MPLLNDVIESGAFTGYGDQAQEYERQQRRIRREAAFTVLGLSPDAPAALLVLDVLGLHGPEAEFPGTLRDLREFLDAARPPEPEPWTPERLRDAIIALAAGDEPFSANHFYRLLPGEAWHLIGPAIQAVRRRHLVSAGSEIAVNPARKGSRVTVYRGRRD